MGADPGTAMIISALISSGLGFAGGALGGGGGENMEGFTGENDPQGILDSLRPKLDQAWGAVNEQLQRPINLPSSYVQRLPTFTGGGLPMPIGVTGVDPALSNPKLLTFDPQISNFKDQFPPDEDSDGVPDFPRDMTDYPPGSVPGTGVGEDGSGIDLPDSPGREWSGEGVSALTEGASRVTEGASSPGVARRPSPFAMNLNGLDDFADEPPDRRQARGATDLLLAVLGR